jgi:hypothetical protein
MQGIEHFVLGEYAPIPCSYTGQVDSPTQPTIQLVEQQGDDGVCVGIVLDVQWPGAVVIVMSQVATDV